jgi:uncharacterized membrane protein HdeD (DUF308 family)
MFMADGVTTHPSDRLADLGASWGWLLAFAILTFIVGIVIVIHPTGALSFFAILLGLQLFIGGIFRLVAAFTRAGEGHRTLFAILGIVSIIVGILCLRHVMQTIAVLGLLLGIFWVVNGLIEFFVAVAEKDVPNRGLTVVMGIIGFIVGIVVLVYPSMSLAALTWVLGLWLLVLGVLGIVGAFRARRMKTA